MSNEKLEMTLGVDLSAYVTLTLPQGTDRSIENLKQIAKDAYENSAFNGEEIMFEEDWSTVDGLRIVSVTDNGQYIIEGVPVYRQDSDAGHALFKWLNGQSSLEQMVDEAVASHLIEDKGMQQYTARFAFPCSKVTKVQFQCRKGANEDERLLAFAKALISAEGIDFQMNVEDVK